MLTGLGVAALVVCSLAPCANGAESEAPYPIPDSVLASADEYVIAKVGRAFFDSCLTWSPGLSCFKPLQNTKYASDPNTPDWLRYPRYVVIYKLRIPGKPFCWKQSLRPRCWWKPRVSFIRSKSACVKPARRLSVVEWLRPARMRVGRRYSCFWRAVPILC